MAKHTSKTLFVDWDELVFRYRNREYGAYALRKSHMRTTIVSFGLATLFLLLLLFLPGFAAWVEAASGSEVLVVNPEIILQIEAY